MKSRVHKIAPKELNFEPDDYDSSYVVTMRDGVEIKMCDIIAKHINLPNPNGYTRIAYKNNNKLDHRGANLMYVPDNYRWCDNCKKTCTTLCSGCKEVYYCSAECQAKDWSKHKLVCKK